MKLAPIQPFVAQRCHRPASPKYGIGHACSPRAAGTRSGDGERRADSSRSPQPAKLEQQPTNFKLTLRIYPHLHRIERHALAMSFFFQEEKKGRAQARPKSTWWGTWHCVALSLSFPGNFPDSRWEIAFVVILGGKPLSAEEEKIGACQTDVRTNLTMQSSNVECNKQCGVL